MQMEEAKACLHTVHGNTGNSRILVAMLVMSGTTVSTTTRGVVLKTTSLSIVVITVVVVSKLATIVCTRAIGLTNIWIIVGTIAIIDAITPVMVSIMKTARIVDALPFIGVAMSHDHCCFCCSLIPLPLTWGPLDWNLWRLLLLFCFFSLSFSCFLSMLTFNLSKYLISSV